MSYVENFNEKHFGGNCEKVHFIDQAMANHLVQNTPYWFVCILQLANMDCLSYTITILQQYYQKTGTISSLCYLIVGIMRYVSMISQIETDTNDPKERRMREEYDQYSITLKDIVNSLQVR